MDEKKPDDQIDRFRETARELEADEDESSFKEKLGVIARQKPKADQTPTKTTRRK